MSPTWTIQLIADALGKGWGNVSLVQVIKLEVGGVLLLKGGGAQS